MLLLSKLAFELSFLAWCFCLSNLFRFPSTFLGLSFILLLFLLFPQFFPLFLGLLLFFVLFFLLLFFSFFWSATSLFILNCFLLVMTSWSGTVIPSLPVLSTCGRGKLQVSGKHNIETGWWYIDKNLYEQKIDSKIWTAHWFYMHPVPVVVQLDHGYPSFSTFLGKHRCWASAMENKEPEYHLGSQQKLVEVGNLTRSSPLGPLSLNLLDFISMWSFKFDSIYIYAWLYDSILKFHLVVINSMAKSGPSPTWRNRDSMENKYIHKAVKTQD